MTAEVTPLHAVADQQDDGVSKRKPSTLELAEQLVAREPYATGGTQLYAYIDGCYTPGERHLQRRLVEMLGHSWSRRKAQEIFEFVRVTSPELWERPPLETINVPNGLLDVRTRTLRKHTAEHLSPVRIAATYSPAATCPAADAFLASTAPELTPLLLEIAGLLLIPDERFQKSIMLKGPGGTGKTTFLELLAALIGQANVSRVALHQLEEDRFASADLFGMLANVFADLPGQALRSSSIFKSIVGGDVIRGERKGRDAFRFKPFARLLFSANAVPPTADSSDAFFERWTVLPFEHKHRGTSHEDKGLLPRITTPAELSGLLNRALDGLDRLHKQQHFSRIAASENAAERFRIDSDSAAGFCEERCQLDPATRIAKPALFKAYRTWCEDNNRHPLAAQRFNARLRELHAGNIDENPSKGVDYWTGINLREPEQ